MHGLGLLMPIVGVLAVLTATVAIAASYNVSAEEQCGNGVNPSSSPSASAQGQLCITSPPDKSIIAISDPKFVDGADVGPNDRAPNLDMLKLIVTGTSSCSGRVTVNGVAADPPTGAWTAKIPLIALATGGVGQVTLTAKAGGCSDASSMVTLINLEITSPKENASEPITAEPAMPDLNATVSVLGYPGDTSGVTFNWKLDLRNETVSRGTYPHWSPGPETFITGSTTGTGEAWQPGSDEIVGGVGRLTATATLPGVTDTVTSFPRWINIPGSSLGQAAVDAYLQASPAAQYASTISQVFCVESRWQQFNSNVINGDNPKYLPQPAIPNVPSNWRPNPGAWQPIYGGPAGIGVAQYDPESGTAPLEDYWNWHANVDQGISIFEGYLQEAGELAGSEQERLTDRRMGAIEAATANRAAKGIQTPPTVAPLVTVPALSDQQIIWETVRLYNGEQFDEYHFNADYVLSANGLNVNLVAVDPFLPEGWVGGTSPAIYGAPSSPAGSWATPSANLRRPMRWSTVGPIQSYDDQVRLCPDLPPGLG